MKMKKSDGGGGGANWMDTYGDMVTLLLCFFVLLYSMSTVDENKWKALVQSFNPNAVFTPTDPEGNGGPLADPPITSDSSAEGLSSEAAALAADQEEIDNAMEELYDLIRQYIQDSGKNIEVTKGDGVVYVNFDDAVFFDGESYIIRPEGRETLDVFCGVLAKAAPHIDEVRVMGHTAQANVDRPNEVEVDRMLSSNRATQTVIYIQEHCTELDPARLISEGYGQHRPLADNTDEAGRARNRRVEMMISGKNVYSELGDSIQQYNYIASGQAEKEASSGEEEPTSHEIEGDGAGQSNGEGQERG